MFGLFKKKESGPAIRDLVWMSESAKKQGALALIKEARNPVVAAWFKESIYDWQRFFEAEGISIEVQDAAYLQSLDVKDRAVFLLEHYPLASKESKLMQSWKPAQLTAFISLEDPLLQLFGGDRIISLMQKMGASESEVIEHTMISRSIRNAQEKLDKKTTVDHPADSQQQWFAFNSAKYPK